MRMLSLSNLLLLFFAAGVAADGVGDFAKLTPVDKMKVFQRLPDKYLDDRSQLLKLYILALQDSSIEVQARASQSAYYLVLALKGAKSEGRPFDFPRADVAEFRRNLIKLTVHRDPVLRVSSATALMAAEPFNTGLEKMVLEQLRNEKIPEFKAALVDAMGNAGYNSPQFIESMLKLLPQQKDHKLAYSVPRVLGGLKSAAAIDMLIACAVESSPVQQHAIRALGAYGDKAIKALPALERLVADDGVSSEIKSIASNATRLIKLKEQTQENVPALSPGLWTEADGEMNYEQEIAKAVSETQ